MEWVVQEVFLAVEVVENIRSVSNFHPVYYCYGVVSDNDLWESGKE